MSKLLEFGGGFPFIRLHEKRAQPWEAPDLSEKEWVVLPDGRCGVVDHIKWDGVLGVRPVNIGNGEYLPNTTQHWTMADRWSIPEELAVTREQVRPAAKHEIPEKYR